MWVTFLEAAARTGQTRAEIDEAITTGALPAKREGHLVLVDLPGDEKPAKAAPKKRKPNRDSPSAAVAGADG
jgi:hypothetical protein